MPLKSKAFRANCRNARIANARRRHPNISMPEINNSSEVSMPDLNDSSEVSMPETSSPSEGLLPETSNPSEVLMPETSSPSEGLMPETSNPSEVSMPETSSPSEVTMPETSSPSEVTIPETSSPSEVMTPKRKRTSLVVEYVTPKRNHPQLSKFRTPKNKADILNPKPRNPVPEGRRMFTIGALEAAMNAASKHKGVCSAANFFIKDERRAGLSSQFEVKCTSCNRPTFWIKNDDDHCSVTVNEGGVWGANATGVGFTSMKHSLAVLDVPFMTNKTFIGLENQFSKKLDFSHKAQLRRNGEEEYNKAIELEQYILVDGVKIAWTFVNVDGQWSKRSYNQAGKANSGSACIIGLLTKQPLYVGVKNKFCLICRKSKGREANEHQCYKNFAGPSSSMEAAIIAEGFRESVEKHRLIYKYMIGDGDSSVHNEVRLVYHKHELNYTVVEKIECKNHAIRRMNKKFVALLSQKLYPSEHRKVLEERFSRIGKCCAYIIQHNVDNKPITNTKTLKFDLENVLFHAFGDHSKCKAINCIDGISVVPLCMMKHSTNESDANKVSAKSKKKSPCVIQKIVDHPIWHAMQAIVAKLASHSVSLMYAVTTNISESFQSHMNKFLQGRRIHYSSRGGYNRKAAAASFSFQFGQAWYGHAFRHMYKKSPSSYWKKMDTEAGKVRRQIKKPKTSKVLFQKYNKPKHLSKSYIGPEGDEFYGENSRKADMPLEEMLAAIDDLRNSLTISSKAVQFDNHTMTIGQWDNPKYLTLHKNRITASKCGVIYTLRDTTSNASTIDSILYASFTGNDATAWGRINERRAVSCYEQMQQVTVSPAGLFISLQDGVLAASPDGLVGKDGLIEIKCPFIEKSGLPEDVLKRKTNKYLVKTGSEYTLSQTSHYYYQVVMQLHVTEREWCDFIIWTQGPADPQDPNTFVTPEGHILVIRIVRSETTDLWEKMAKKLTKFWTHDLAPEIVDSRRARRDGFRQPPYREKAMNERSSTKQSRLELYDETIDAVLKSYQ